MNKKYLIGIDNGTQSTKISIFTHDGEEVAFATQPHAPIMRNQPGWAEHPQDDLWNSISSALKKVMLIFSGDVKDIVGLGLCTVGCSRVFLKKDGTLARPIMSWMDIRAYREFQDADDIFFTCSSSGYIAYKLTGELKDAAANSYQWQFPVDTKTLNWISDSKIFSKHGIPPHKLIDIYPSGTILGHITESIAIETGLPKGLPVIATANDKPVETLGSGVIDGSGVMVSCGTNVTSTVHVTDWLEDGENFYSFMSAIPHEFTCSSMGVRYGMGHVSWLKKIFGNEVNDIACSLGLSLEDYLQQEAEKTPPGSEGLYVIPDLLAPHTETYRKGVILGLMPHHTRGHIYRSFLESIVITIKENCRRMLEELNATPQEIVISGGGSQSTLMMQIFSDSFGMPVYRTKASSNTAMGAAICASVGLGLYEDFRVAVNSMVTRGDCFAPDKYTHDIYNKMCNNYNSLPALMVNALKMIEE